MNEIEKKDAGKWFYGKGYADLSSLYGEGFFGYTPGAAA